MHKMEILLQKCSICCVGEKKEISETTIEMTKKAEVSATRQIQVVQTLQESGESATTASSRRADVISSRRHAMYTPDVVSNMEATNRGEPVFVQPLQSMRVRTGSHACFQCRLLGNASRVRCYRVDNV